MVRYALFLVYYLCSNVNWCRVIFWSLYIVELELQIDLLEVLTMKLTKTKKHLRYLKFSYKHTLYPLLHHIWIQNHILVQSYHLPSSWRVKWQAELVSNKAKQDSSRKLHPRISENWIQWWLICLHLIESWNECNRDSIPWILQIKDYGSDNNSQLFFYGQFIIFIVVERFLLEDGKFMNVLLIASAI